MEFGLHSKVIEKIIFSIMYFMQYVELRKDGMLPY